MKNIYNITITKDELKDELKNFANSNGYNYYDEVYKTAIFLDKENNHKFEETGEYWFIPRALIPIAFEAWWQLQHNVDSYGCDYEWVYDDEGMSFILVEDQQCNLFWWGSTKQDFVEFWNL